MSNFIKLFLLLSIGLSTTCTYANMSDWNFGVGVMNQTPGRYQTQASGEKSSMNNRMMLETGLVYELDEDWSILSDIGMLWPGGSDENFISKQVYYLNGHLGYALNESFLLRLGFGLYYTRLSGDGGTTPIRNGTGFTDFYVPEESSIAQNATVNVAGEYFFNPDYSLKAEVFLFNLTNSLNRTYNVALSVRYHLGDSLWKD
jgi:hypothetical protein